MTIKNPRELPEANHLAIFTRLSAAEKLNQGLPVLNDYSTSGQNRS